MLFREFTYRDLYALVDTTRVFKLPFWLEGGWGVDVLIGHPTRWHSDVDIIMESSPTSIWVEYLTSNGWELLADECAPPWSLSYGNEKGTVYDIHVVDLDDEGNARCGPDRVYPAEALRTKRQLDQNKYREVRCLSAKWQVRFHTGYDVDAEDYQDVLALHNKFRVKIPPEYDRFR